MPAVESQQGLNIQPFSDSDDYRIDGAQGKVGVLLNEVRGAKVVSLDRIDYSVLTQRQAPKKPSFNSWRHQLLQEVRDFPKNDRRNENLAPI